jgi:hypothetical protein
MVARAKLYVEGAGSSKEQKALLREAVSGLLDKAGLKKRPRIVASGSRLEAYKDFVAAQKNWNRSQEEKPFLLVDSKDSVSGTDTSVDSPIAWDHLKKRVEDKWDRPANAENHQAMLMATCMETWIISDPEEIAKAFGKDFKTDKLPPTILETRNRKDLERLLIEASSDCKGPYKKGDRSFEVFGVIRPEVIRKKLPHAERFFRILEEKL